MSKHIIGVAKRTIKPGEVVEFRIREDGFCESADIRFRPNIAFLDIWMLRHNSTKEVATEAPANG